MGNSVRGSSDSVEDTELRVAEELRMCLRCNVVLDRVNVILGCTYRGKLYLLEYKRRSWRAASKPTESPAKTYEQPATDHVPRTDKKKYGDSCKFSWMLFAVYVVMPVDSLMSVLQVEFNLAGN